jgi:hypothetical protein
LSYFRHSYTSFEEFRREALSYDESEHPLGKEELELLMDLEDEDQFDKRPAARKKRSYD